MTEELTIVALAISYFALAQNLQGSAHIAAFIGDVLSAYLPEIKDTWITD